MNWLATGAIAAGLGVALGAFGAHVLKPRLAADLLAIFETGVRFHIYHALGLLAVAWAAARSPGMPAQLAGWSFTAGIVIFSGSLYVLAVTGQRWLGMITPVGGIAFLVGWAALAVAALRPSVAELAAIGDEEKLARIEARYQDSARQFPEVPEITAQELRRREGSDDIVLVDVRSPEEQAVSMIPGAITQRQLEADPEKYREATVVTYCTIGHRSGLYAKKLRDKGFDAVNLRGAILAWTHAGGDLVDENGPTRRVHVVSPEYGLTAEGYEPVW